jgi:hypothetical protein
MKELIVIIILISNSAFAQNAVTLNKGDITPFSGILVKSERLDKLVKAEQSNVVLSDLRISQDELIDFHKQDARTQRNKLSKAEFKGFLANTGYFVLGVIITGFAFKVNQKIGDM